MKATKPESPGAARARKQAEQKQLHDESMPKERSPHDRLYAKELQEANRRLQEQKVELEQLMQELLRHRDHLEELVDERTKELKTANEYLGREIMERARAERELKKANKLLERVFSSINVLIAYMDAQFNFIRVNRSYAEAEQHDPEFFVGKNHFALFPNKRHEDIFRGVIETGEPFVVYGEPFKYLRGYRRKKEYWDWSLSPVKERDGNVSGLVLNMVNVTDRIRAEEALRESEKKFRRLSQEFNTLLDAIPDAILLLSPDLKTLWSNKGAALLLGEEIAGLTGQYCHTLWHNLPAPCDDCHVLRCLASGREERRQITLPNGRVFDSRAFPIKDEGGSVVNVITIASDTTERMVLQAEVMRSDHLASIGKLAAGVAHEINNPINGIINYAQLLANKSPKESKEHDIAARIIKEGDRIATIVRSLLSFARDHKEQKAAAHLKEICADTLALTEAQLRKDGIALTVSFADNLPPVIANTQQIQQVFLNIISNAQYALNTRFPGKHEDKALEITGESFIADGVPFVRISLRDQGPGIPAEILDKVKDPFFSTKPTGTGLGLSISHGIISDHGGRLTIQSTEHAGTTIVVDLPAKRPEESRNEEWVS
ncbi:MAG: PAS domain-containing protein [Nitrospirota bacterium]